MTCSPQRSVIFRQPCFISFWIGSGGRLQIRQVKSGPASRFGQMTALIPTRNNAAPQQRGDLAAELEPSSSFRRGNTEPSEAPCKRLFRADSQGCGILIDRVGNWAPKVHAVKSGDARAVLHEIWPRQGIHSGKVRADFGWRRDGRSASRRSLGTCRVDPQCEGGQCKNRGYEMTSKVRRAWETAASLEFNRSRASSRPIARPRAANRGK